MPPVIGSHWRVTAKSRISRSPDQKIGMESPPSDRSMASRSTHVSWYTAARSPRPTPTTTVMPMAASASRTVYGSISTTDVRTGRFV